MKILIGDCRDTRKFRLTCAATTLHRTPNQERVRCRVSTKKKSTKKRTPIVAAVSRRLRVARPSDRKIRLLRDWLATLNSWTIPKTFMNNCMFIEAHEEEEKMYVCGAYDAIRNALDILASRGNGD